MSKTQEERFMMRLEMTESGRDLMLAGIKQAKPGLSIDEYKIELLQRMIRYDITLKWLEKLMP